MTVEITRDADRNNITVTVETKDAMGIFIYNKELKISILSTKYRFIIYILKHVTNFTY